MSTSVPKRRRSSEDIGRAIKDLRIAAGLTQEQLGLKLDVTQGQVSMWERAVNTPSLPQVKKIEKVCHAPQGAVLRLSHLSPEFSTREAILTDPELLPQYRSSVVVAYDIAHQASVAQRRTRKPKN